MIGSDAVGSAFRREHGRAVAVLTRAFGDLQLAEDAVQDAFVRALEDWPARGVPPSPEGWILTTARRAAIDRLRRRSVGGEKETAAVRDAEPAGDPDDDRLRLLFTCAHPALDPAARIALTLRLVCGVPTARIAALLLVPEATLAQRLVRAKRKIRLAGIPYRVPGPEELASRLDDVLTVVYLLFTAGYTADGAEAVRPQLTDEALRVARLLALLMPKEGEVHALLALLLLVDARRPARIDDAGRLRTLAEQDRSRYDRSAVAEGLGELARAVQSGRVGPFLLEAAIQAEHDVAPDAAATDWRRIVSLYDDLLALRRSTVVALNRAVALAEVDGPAAALAVVEALPPVPRRDDVRADLLRRLGRTDEAAAAYRAALAAPRNDAERAFLTGRLEGLLPPPGP